MTLNKVFSRAIPYAAIAVALSVTMLTFAVYFQ